MLARMPQLAATALEGSAASAEYRALVCVFLLGGNDSFNMVVPLSDAEYAEYSRARQDLALGRTELLPLQPLTRDLGGARYGLHPAMPELEALFNKGEVCAVIANVGPLMQPTTKAAYLDGSADLPPQLFSHVDQQNQWHCLHGTRVLNTGWAGRISDALTVPDFASNSDPAAAINVSLSGRTPFQSGSHTVPYTIGPTGPVKFTGLHGVSTRSLTRRKAFEALLEADHSTVYERAFAEMQQRALVSAEKVSNALATVRPPNAPPFKTGFPPSALGSQLRTVAEMIAIRHQLNVSRQIFFVAMAGFDTHDRQREKHPALLADLSRSLDAFYRATVAMNISSQVTTFTASEFGRTLTSNGDGTDHGWGGVQLVVGGAVRGRSIYGSYPVLQLKGEHDVGGGRIIPTLSSDQYAITLARWFGVPDAQLVTIAPNIVNFGARDLGFMRL